MDRSTRTAGSACVLLAFALVAGCVGGPETTTPDPGPEPNVTPVVGDPVTTSIEFLVSGTSVFFNGQPNGGSVEAGANATRLLMEARWTCDSPTCELRLILIPPEGTTSDSAVGTGEGRLEVAASLGTWNAQVRPTDAVVNARGEIRVTEFAGEIPEGFTAFE